MYVSGRSFLLLHGVLHPSCHSPEITRYPHPRSFTPRVLCKAPHPFPILWHHCGTGGCAFRIHSHTEGKTHVPVNSPLLYIFSLPALPLNSFIFDYLVAAGQARRCEVSISSSPPSPPTCCQDARLYSILCFLPSQVQRKACGATIGSKETSSFSQLAGTTSRAML